MGKLLKGINGPFSGKVGTAVGYMWNDIAVIRARPRKRRKPFSDKELNQQARFTLMNEFLIPVKNLLNISFAHLAYRMSGFHKGFSYNVKAAILGIRPDLSIDYPRVLLSRGDLAKAETATVTALHHILCNLTGPIKAEQEMHVEPTSCTSRFLVLKKTAGFTG